MKKALSLFLAFVMCLSLCACGSSDAKEPEDQIDPTVDTAQEETTVPAEDVLENAMVITAYAFYQDASANIVRAENECIGKPVLFWDQIIEIQREYIVVGKHNTRINVYLAAEDIMDVSVDQYVLVAGIVNSISLSENFSLPYVSMDIPQGYLVRHTESDDAALYNNAKRQMDEGNYADAVFVLKTISNYSDSKELLLDAVCKAKYNDQDDNKEWRLLFDKLNCVPLTEEEIAETIVGNWYSSAKSSQYSSYTENGEYHYFMGGEESGANIPKTWYVEDGRLVTESQYTRSENVIFHFYKNAYVFLSPQVYNQVTEDVYELRFLNGPTE